MGIRFATLHAGVSRHARLVLIATLLPALASTAGAQAADPAFQLSSSQIFTSRDRPAVYLTFQQLDHLDFRVYRVQDPVAFFAGLEDPHELGGPEPLVPQEPTLIERIATWKGTRRAALRAFGRRQFSPEYRQARRRQLDDRIVERRTVAYTEFAQVPLLNERQLVASWRELLPRTRDAEVRRLPLELPGGGVFVVEAVTGLLRAYTIVVVSDVGLVTKTAPGHVLAYVANRFDGTPRAGCGIHGLAGREAALSLVTGDDGVASGPAAIEGDGFVVLARCGDEVVVTDPGGWSLREPRRRLRAYVYTDRPVYRPGHRVHGKAVLRWGRPEGLAPFDRGDVEVIVEDPNQRVLLRERRPVDEFGTVHFSLALPADTGLGHHAVRIASGEEEGFGSFEVQEYRKPEFDVRVSTPERFVLQGGAARVAVAARYYFGQPVAGGRVSYVVYRSPYYSPQRWADASEGEGYFYGDGGEQVSEASAVLDARGTATLSVPVPVEEDGSDAALRIEARVTDASGREVSGETRVYATVGTFMLVASVDRHLQAPGGTVTARVRALDYQGVAQPGVDVTATLERVVYGAGEPRVTELARGAVRTDETGMARWTARLPDDRAGGHYRVRMQARSGERTVSDTANLWVAGATEETYDEDQVLELVADRPTYAPGDAALLMIRGSEVDGAVLITKERETTTWHEVRRLSAAATFEVPIAPDDVGDVYVNIAFLRDGRLHRAERRLSVPPVAQRLDLTVTAAQAISRPQEGGLFTVRALDADGRPVRAQVSVGVVDEALYGVRPDTTPDPVRFFHRLAYSRVATQFSREYAFFGYSGTHRLQLAQRRRPFSLADFKADRPERPEVRREFPDAIHWVADLVTGADGTATVRVTYPDALTTWRVTARAITTDTRAGTAVARATVTKDVIVRVIAPRFLVEGDRLRLPVVAHNYLPDVASFGVSIEATGLAPGDGTPAAPVRADVPSGGEARSAWPFTATTVGRATIIGRLTAPAGGDAVEIALPVLPYGLPRESGAAGSITLAGEGGARLAIPTRSHPAERTIAVSLAPSMAGSLLSALDYLTTFPYGCTEQLVSSFVPNLVVVRALAELGIAPTERTRQAGALASQGVRRLLDLQQEEGGFGWWKTGEPDPFMTAYALYGLLESQRGGVAVNRWRMIQAARVTASLYREYPRMVPELKAYLAYVMGRAQQAGLLEEIPDDAWAPAAVLDELWAARGRSTPHGRALMLLAFDQAQDGRGDELARTLIDEAQVQGDLAWWPAAGDPLLGDIADTSAEATAFAIRALAPRFPQHATLERAMRWLMANRQGGYWVSTKQTAMTLYALLDYVTARNERPTTFSVEVRVNGEPAGRHTFTPASWSRPDPIVLTVPAREGDNEVRVVKEGEGAVYWTASARYVDNAASLEATGDRRLAISRQYFSLSPVKARDGTIVYRESAFGGTLVTGDLLLVRLTVAGARDWRYLVIEDPIPAGTEAVTRREQYRLEREEPWWQGWHREYRDNRVVLFQQEFGEGRYEYTYVLRGVTPGEFQAMPARILPMYVPGVFASSAAERMTIDD
jgi:alpha-2-macroglobulin